MQLIDNTSTLGTPEGDKDTSPMTPAYRMSLPKIKAPSMGRALTFNFIVDVSSTCRINLLEVSLILL